MKIATSHPNPLSKTVQLPGISQAAPAGKWGVTHWMDANKKAGLCKGCVCVRVRACRIQELDESAQEKRLGYRLASQQHGDLVSC